MFEKLKSILYKNQFDVFFGKVYEESNLHGIAVNYYFTNSIVKIPNKNFIGLPDYTFRLLLYSARLLKDEKEREVRIFDGEYVLILYKKGNQICVYYQWKYCIKKISDNLIHMGNRATQKKLFYKGSYLDFIKKLYNISLELQKKLEKYGIVTAAEVELPQQMDMLKKHIAKIEKSLA